MIHSLFVYMRTSKNSVRLLAICLLLLASLVSLQAHAAAGDMDTSFNPGSGANDEVDAIALQADGKVLIGGMFSIANGETRNGIARFDADGSLDSAFKSGGGAANDWVGAIVQQPDGNVLIGGDFMAVDGVTRHFVARLHADGTLDSTFRSSGSDDHESYVEALSRQADGKVLIGGWFTTVHGMPRKSIARLHMDGELDTAFNPGDGCDGEVWALALQPDGKVLVGGSFTAVDGVSRNDIARLNADGSLDTAFNPGNGTNGSVSALALQADGKVLVGGWFTTVNGMTRNHLARLHADGSLDTTFNPGNGANGSVYALALQADGKVLIGGSFTAINGITRNRIARLHADGSLDTAFNPAGITTGFFPSVRALTLQADGKLLIGGEFAMVNGIAGNRIARLHTGDVDGDSVDDAADYFVDNAAAAADVDRDGLPDVWLQPNSYGCVMDAAGCNGLSLDSFVDSDRDGVMAADNCPAVYNPDQLDNDGDAQGNACDNDHDNDGVFDWVDNCSLQANASQADVDADGAGDICDAAPAQASAGVRDLSFNPGIGANAWVGSLMLQPDGKLLMTGDFMAVNGVARSRVARLNNDGSLDASFNNADAGGAVYALAQQHDGKLLVGGNFSMIGNIGRDRIARLHADGTLDSSFDPGTGANSTVRAVAVQADGKVLMGGHFTEVDGVARNCIARLHADGSLDNSFKVGGGANGIVTALVLQTDGKVLIGGWFTAVNGVARNRIARLNNDGSLDALFNPGDGANGAVYALAQQHDGKQLIGGAFTAVNGVARNRIARLNADGSLDTSFNPGSGVDNDVEAIVTQADGKMLIGGVFTAVNGIARNYIARLNADGSLDTTFNPGSNNAVYALILQADGKLLLGGDFTLYDNTAINRVVRLHTGDMDADGVQDGADYFAGNAAAVQDVDRDGLPDAWLQPNSYGCTVSATSCNGLGLDSFVDSDRDGVEVTDNCPALHNLGQFNADGDAQGDSCDSDDDNDGLPDEIDNCPLQANAAQQDVDADGAGDVCDVAPHQAPAAGTYDMSFKVGRGTNSDVMTITSQADNSLLIGGWFSTVSAVARLGVARLHTNGLPDSAFDSGSGYGLVESMAVQTDGKVIIGGQFYAGNGAAHNGIQRLDADGSPDMTFDPGSGTDSGVTAVALQADGKVLIGGYFTAVNGVMRNHIARLHVDGSLDSTFDPGSGPNDSVLALAPQTDGKVLIGGSFAVVNGVTRRGVARLNADGSLDSAFDPGSGTSRSVRALVLQADGKVLIGGNFLAANGGTRSNIARLHTDGSLDAAFNPDSSVNDDVRAIALQADGKLLIGGRFNRFSGLFPRGIARLHVDGSLDTSFNSGIGVNGEVSDLTLQRDGKLIVGGGFSYYDVTAINGIARVHTGDVDADGVQDGADYFAGDAAAADADRDGLPDAWLQPNSFGCLAGVASCNGLTLDNDDDNDSVPDYIDADPLNAAVQSEKALLLNGIYQGSAVHEWQALP